MTTGWDDRGNRGDRQPDDCTKLWIGNLRGDLTPQGLTDWLTDRDFQLERPVELVPWRLKRAEETISFIECPYPIPPSPQLLQYVLFGHVRGTAETPASRE